MAIVSVMKMWSKTTGGWDDTSRQTSVGYTVLTDDASTSELDILSANDGTTRIPPYGEQLESDQYSRVRAARILRKISPLLSEVQVDYFSVGVGADPSLSEDPLSARADVEWDYVDFEATIDSDADGNPLTTAAGEPFRDVTETKSHLLLTISHYEPTFNARIARKYKNAVNADEFLDFEIGTVKCNFIKGRRLWSGTAYYWRVTYQFEICEYGETWERKFLNAGTMRLTVDPDSDKPDQIEMVPIKYLSGEQKGEPVSEPVQLSENGFLSILDHPKEPGKLGKIHRKYWTKKRIDFAPLNIPAIQ